MRCHAVPLTRFVNTLQARKQSDFGLLRHNSNIASDHCKSQLSSIHATPRYISFIDYRIPLSTNPVPLRLRQQHQPLPRWLAAAVR